MAADDLIVYRKTEELFDMIYPSLSNFPKSEKFSMCHDIKWTFYNLLSYISLGNSVKSKRVLYLQEADARLQVLKTLFKTSKKRRYISVGFFEEIDLKLTEINKLLSGYIRASAK